MLTQDDDAWPERYRERLAIQGKPRTMAELESFMLAVTKAAAGHTPDTALGACNAAAQEKRAPSLEALDLSTLLHAT